MAPSWVLHTLRVMRAFGIAWDGKPIDEYLRDPKKFIPGNGRSLDRPPWAFLSDNRETSQGSIPKKPDSRGDTFQFPGRLQMGPFSMDEASHAVQISVRP